MEVSIAFAFLQFIVIIIVNLNKIFRVDNWCTKRKGYQLMHQDADSSDEMIREREEDTEIHNQNVHILRNTVQC